MNDDRCARSRRTRSWRTMVTRTIRRRSRRWKPGSRRSNRCSSSTACSTPTGSTPSSPTSSTTSGRSTAPRWWPGHGSIRTTRSGCSPTGRRRSPSSASVDRKATTWSSSRTRRPCTTSSCARCARATRGRRSACRRRGTRRRRTGRVPFGNRGSCSRRWGRTLPDDVSIRVWDSSAEVRYLVLPERPAGTDDFSEEDLAALVTRDSMIGVQRL